ncbi:MAG TPA: nuclear transport factor 2 family protein [Thermoleophilaceae bacterium]|nr:nuclear transport factor 2 family protein [Thermoleophilaceae bacterium]
MSSENLDIVRRCVTARDSSGYAAVARFIHPDVVVDLTARPDGRIFRGRAEAARALQSWIGQWEEYSYEAERFIDAGEHIIVFFREHGRGRESGVTSEIVGATVWTVAAGKVIATKTYTNRREALDAVGLRE